MMFDISLNLFTENFPDILKLKFDNFFKTDLSQQRNSSGVVTRLRCSIKIYPLFFSYRRHPSLLSLAMRHPSESEAEQNCIGL